MSIDLYLGNNIEVLKQFSDNYFDSVVTDPPYGISFMNHKWDYDVPSIELWKEVIRVLKPGGHILVFCGTRTQHRMVCNIEDAGFEIRDVITWLHGQGLPKSLNISKQIDKQFGLKRKVIGISTNGKGSDSGSNIYVMNNGSSTMKKEFEITEPASEESKYWSGWGTTLKPACEFITLARKPISEKNIALNVLKWRTGGINVDDSRIKIQGEIVPINKLESWSGFGQKIRPDYVQEINIKGRFPANLILDDESGELLDEQSGITKASDTVRHNKQSQHTGKENNAVCYEKYNDKDTVGYKDIGGASRFFYCAKANKKEKGINNDHPTVKPTKLMEYLVKLITPPNGKVLDCFMGSGSTGIACKHLGFDFYGVDINEEYINIAKERIENEDKNKEE